MNENFSFISLYSTFHDAFQPVTAALFTVHFQCGSVNFYCEQNKHMYNPASAQKQ